jgi:PleD family two-component response regulator
MTHTTRKVGTSVCLQPDRYAAVLAKAADTALYRAKANGRNRFETLIAAVSDPHAPPVGA